METVENVLRGRGKDEEVPQNKITVKIEDRPEDGGAEETNHNNISRKVEYPREGKAASAGAASSDAITEADVTGSTIVEKVGQTAKVALKTGAKRVVYDPALNEVKVIDVDTGMIEDRYAARSGPLSPKEGSISEKFPTWGEKRGALPPGIWKPAVAPSERTPSNGNNYIAMLDKTESSWFQYIEPQFPTDPQRTEIGFHPDGNVPRTNGCIGILREDTKSIFEWWIKHWSHTTVEVVEGRGGVTMHELKRMKDIEGKAQR